MSNEIKKWKAENPNESAKIYKRKFRKGLIDELPWSSPDVSKTPGFLKEYQLPDPVCLYKWNWSTIRLYEGTTNSCHRVKSDFITPENFENFHNTPTKLKHRQMMLNGKWPGDGCEYCKDIEDAGGTSDRLDVNSSDYNVPKEFKKNNKSLSVTPKLVEVYFNNLCNLACVYCNGNYSTVWEAEETKFGLVHPQLLEDRNKARAQYPAILKKHFQWLEKNGKHIAEYRVLGGEPFFQPEFEQNIDFFASNPCPDTDFKIFSNLKVSDSKMRKLLDKIVDLIDKKHIRSFEVVCSLDCWGPQQEYIRTGLSMKSWEKNFLTLLNDYPQIGLLVHGTIIALTMDTMHELYAKVTEWNKVRKVKHSISFASGTPGMAANIFPKEFFKDQFQKCRDATTDPRTLNMLNGFEKTVDNSDESPEMIKKLITTLNNIDKRRGTNWKILWPWLKEIEDGI
jgi:organic radical activating enzyme